MHKILAGLRDAQVHCDNGAALRLLASQADLIGELTRGLSPAQFQRMLDVEHGGMNEVLADAAELAREPSYLALAQRFCHRALLEPLADSRDTLDGLHSNTQIPKTIGFARLHQLTGDPQYAKAAEFFWRTVTERRSFATGGNADREHFFPPAEFARRLGSAKTMETCCTHNMLRLTRALSTADPAVHYADYYERALYNGILASQDPESGMMTYFQATRPGYLKLYCTPLDSFWCCTGSGMENHAKYGDSIYFHDDTHLYVNLFIASELQWPEKGLTLTQETSFPEEEATRLRVTLREPVRLAIHIRHPYWCQTATFDINGKPALRSRDRMTYVVMDRVWHSGDVIDVRLPMALRTEALPGASDRVALLYGPLVLAGTLGSAGITPGADLIVNERTSGDVLDDAVTVPALKGDSQDIVGRVARVDGALLTFRTTGIGDPHDVTLIPYYRVAHERYNLYWKVEPVRPTARRAQ
jgi:DUF1680 family protein